MNCKAITLMIFSMLFLIISIGLLSTAVLSDHWHNIRVNRKPYVPTPAPEITTTTTEKITTEIQSTAMYNITLPPFHIPNCTCRICPKVVIYINVTFLTPTPPTTTTTTTRRTKRYRTTIYGRRTKSTTRKKKPRKGKKITTTGNLEELFKDEFRHDHAVVAKPPSPMAGNIVDQINVNVTNFIVPYTSYRYYNRLVGLFRVCFTDERPEEVDTKCTRISYASIITHNTTERYTYMAWKKLHMLRAVVTLLLLAVIIEILVFCTMYITGCLGWSPMILGILSLILMFAFILAIAGMIVFHFAEKTEKKSWEPDVRLNSTIEYEYAYAIAWIGIILILFNALLVNMFAAQMRSQMVDDDSQNVFYYYYYGERD